jgi:Na+-transporting NADH:ubiquinone oxidoreductase subunit A
MSKVIKIRKGLNIPLLGEAEKILQLAPRAESYAVCPPDFHGLTPKMLVREGDKVKAGSPLFFDKYNEDILFTSPVSGTFSILVRGDKRRILELRIDPDETDEYVDFGIREPDSMKREEIIAHLMKAGLWPMIRQRPYSIIAKTDITPKSIFVSCFNTSPLSPDLDFVVRGQEAFFQKGIDVLARLTDGDINLGVDDKNTASEAFLKSKNVKVHRFSGPHPAGNVGIQIHHIDSLNKGEHVWYVDVQNLIIIGRLFAKGVYDAEKIVALTGSEVLNPRYYRVISGAQIGSFAQENIRLHPDVNIRFISGDPLTGKRIGAKGYIGFYDNQITLLPEGDNPELIGWLTPNFDKFSISRTFLSFMMHRKKFRHNTNIRSGERPFVITGLYEKVLPMDILPMQLLKAIMTNDIDMMENLGIYELAPEDFALCEYVCPSKTEMQTIIRDGLDVMIKEFS